MNRGITILLLLVIFGAMGLVMYSQSKNRRAGARTTSAQSVAVPMDNNGQRGGYASSVHAPQGNGGLRPIEPPIGVAPSDKGASGPVVLSTGSDPRPVRVITTNRGQDVPSAQYQTAQSRQQAGSQTAQPGSGASAPTTAQSGQTPGSTPALTAGATPWDKSAQGSEKTGSEKSRSTTNQPAAAGAGAAATPDSSPAAGKQPQTAAGNQSEAEKALDKTGQHNMTQIKLSFAEQQIYLRIEAEDAFPVKTFVLTNPDRLVVDLPGTWKGLTTPNVPSNNVVGGVRLGQQPGGPRLVLDLKRPLGSHTTERVGGRVDILMQ